MDGDYRLVKVMGEGTYGTVYSAVCQRDGHPVAVKKVKVRKVEDGLPKELVREVESIEAIGFNYVLEDNFIINIEEVYLGKTSLNIVYRPLCPRLDIHHFLGSPGCQKLTLGHCSAIAFQILTALNAVHSSHLMHRDVKPSNILMHKNQVILGDFGQARVDLTSIDQEELKSEIEAPNLTLEVGSRWYKAPELLFGARKYSQSIDLWSASCIFYELVLRATINACKYAGIATPNHQPLFQGQSDIDQVIQISQVLGTPNLTNWEDIDEMPDYGKIIFKEQDRTGVLEHFQNKFEGNWQQVVKAVEGGAASAENGADASHILASMIEMMDAMMQYSPKRRLTAKAALAKYFQNYDRERSLKDLADLF